MFQDIFSNGIIRLYHISITNKRVRQVLFLSSVFENVPKSFKHEHRKSGASFIPLNKISLQYICGVWKSLFDAMDGHSLEYEPVFLSLFFLQGNRRFPNVQRV